MDAIAKFQADREAKIDFLRCCYPREYRTMVDANSLPAFMVNAATKIQADEIGYISSLSNPMYKAKQMWRVIGNLFRVAEKNTGRSVNGMEWEPIMAKMHAVTNEVLDDKDAAKAALTEWLAVTRSEIVKAIKKSA